MVSRIFRCKPFYACGAKVYDQVVPNTSLVFCPGTKYTSKAQPASCSMQNETITKDHIFFILKKKKVNIGFFFLIVG